MEEAYAPDRGGVALRFFLYLLLPLTTTAEGVNSFRIFALFCAFLSIFAFWHNFLRIFSFFFCLLAPVSAVHPFFLPIFRIFFTLFAMFCIFLEKF